MKVIILKKHNEWMLSISGQGMYKYWLHERLIDALAMANLLNIHVNNIDELPLTQYGLQGEMV